MTRIHVICEGQTEEMFVNEVLTKSFLQKGIYLSPSLIGKPGHKGGNLKFERLLTDIRARLLNDTSAYCTTFFDFYGLPQDFPGKNEAITQARMSQKADCLIQHLTDKLKAELGENALARFIPYVQMYEFEGLLFSQPEKLAEGINQRNLSDALKKIRNDFESPEEINNSTLTAPSKRIEKLYPGYDKPIHGSLAAIEIGLDVIRHECLRFNNWLEKLEALQPKQAK